MAKLSGAAWSVSPVTTLVVHVVNDGSMTLHLHTGTLSGQRIARGALVPDGTGVLAPGQAGTLTAKVTLSCGSTPADAVQTSAVQPLTADIPVSTQNGPTSDVRLISGSKQDDLYVASQLCSGLPPPLMFSVQDIAGTTAQGGGVIRITVHNVSGQPIRYAPEFGFQSVQDTSKIQVIAAGATVVIDVPLSQICSTPGQLLGVSSVELYISTLDGSYQTGYEKGKDMNPHVSVCHG